MRIIRFLLWFIAVIALLAMSYIVAIYFLVNANSVSERISYELDRNFGYKISMHAAPQVRVLPTIEVELPAATVTDKNGQTVFFYRSAYLKVNPIWLVLGQTHIEQLHFNGLSTQVATPNTWSSFIDGLKTEKLAILDDVVIQSLSINQGDFSLTAQDKKLSLRNIALSVNEPAPQMHGAIEMSAQIADTTNGLLFDASAALTLDLDLHQGIIGIENLQLQAQGTRGATPLSLNVSTSLARLEAQNAYISSAEARVITNDGHDQVAFSVADLQLDATQWQAPDFHVYYAQGNGQQRLELDLRSPIIAQWASQNWQAAHIQGSILLPGTGAASPVSGQTTIDWVNQKVDFELFARLHDAPMSFKGQAQSFEHPSINGQLTFGRLDLIELQKLSVLQDVHIGHSFNEQTEDMPIQPEAASDNVASELTETATEPAPLDTNEATEATVTQPQASEPNDQQDKVQTESAEQTVNEPTVVEPQPAPSVVNEEPAQPALSPVVWIETNDGRFMQTQAVTQAPVVQADDHPLEAEIRPFDFTILNAFDFQGEIIIGELVYNNARLLQVKGPVTVTKGTLKMPKLVGLAYESHFNAFASVNSQGHWNTQFKASNVNLEGFLRDLGATMAMPGKLNTQINLYGDAFSLDSLNGQIGFAIQQSALYGLDINDALLTIEKGQIPTQAPEMKSLVSKIQGVATLHEAKATVDSLVVGFEGFALRGLTEVNLKDQQVIGTLKGSNHRGLSVQAALKGAWYQPQLSVDANALMKANGITPKPVMADKPKEKKPSSWDRFKNFIKDRL
ncbi:MAG: hypothetical protein J6V64_04310 [Burkholderiaceae bacterium]|nr:hypothetical protein [Burkholderiaceae bacterium]